MDNDGWVPGEPLDEPGEDQPAGGGPPRTLYPSLDAWMTGHLAPVIRRRFGGGLTWCAQWWEHAEAVSRLNALWQEWEKARVEGTMSNWWLYHADPHLTVLMSKDAGPFMSCKPDRHTTLDPLPIAKSSPDLWRGSAYSDPTASL